MITVEIDMVEGQEGPFAVSSVKVTLFEAQTLASTMSKRLFGSRSTVKLTSLARVASFAAQDPQRRTLAEENISPPLFLTIPKRVVKRETSCEKVERDDDDSAVVAKNDVRVANVHKPCGVDCEMEIEKRPTQMTTVGASSSQHPTGGYAGETRLFRAVHACIRQFTLPFLAASYCRGSIA